jgi:hypothetical protein
MELVLPGAADRERVEALEGEQAEGQAEWEARGPAQGREENVCVPVVELLLPIRRGCRVISGAVPSAER